MKRILRLIALALFLLVIGPSCESLEDCKTCKLVVYENGTKIDETTGTRYCGDGLTAKEDSEPVTVGNRTSVYECE